MWFQQLGGGVDFGTATWQTSAARDQCEERGASEVMPPA